MFLRGLSRPRSRILPEFLACTETMRYRTITSETGGTAGPLYVATTSKPAVLGAVPNMASKKSHWVRAKDGKGELKGFVNPWESYRDFSHSEVIKAMIQHRFSGEGSFPDTTPPTVPVIKPDFLTSRTGSKALRATWLGHACYHVEFPTGLRVLFDPVFEERCSPISWLGSKRYTPTPCNVSDIPIIDVVVISHSHYDHLSHPTILEIQKRHPSVQFCVPKGLKKWFTDCGIDNVVELDWWEDVDLTLSKSTAKEAVAPSQSTVRSEHPKDDILARISCLPCQHTSSRTMFDKGTTLWASWSVSSGDKSVYFGGDTGYRMVPRLPKETDDWGPEFSHLPVCPAFKEIGQLRGPFDLGLIPIGGYGPRDIMSAVHGNPYDSVEIFKDTKCKRAVGTHWGTWVLTFENVLEPPQLLKKALARSGIAETGVFDVCDIGESREF